MSLNDKGNQRCAAMHTVEVVKPLEVGPHGSIRHAHAIRDLLVCPALGNQIDDCGLCRRERIDSACRPTLVRRRRQRELRSQSYSG